MSTIYTDGYTIKRNPSKIGGGFIVMNETGKLLHHEKILKPNFTNNEAELLGVIKAIELADEGDTIMTDSNVTLCWIFYRKCRARLDLKPKAIKAYALMEKKYLSLEQIRREENLAGIHIENNLKK